MSDHDHDHDHAAGQGHDHAHGHALGAPAGDFTAPSPSASSLNIAFVALEAFYGWRVNSLALLADAGHNLSDVAGLVLAWAGALAGNLRPDARHTYGWKRASILAAFANALLLLVAMGSLAWEAFGRLRAPRSRLQGITVMVVAGIGIVVNLGTALLFMRGRNGDLNIRGAFLHMAGDALVSAGVVVAGALALWLRLELARSGGEPGRSRSSSCSAPGACSGSRCTCCSTACPMASTSQRCGRVLEALPGVERVHDLHVWATGTTETALTAHLVMPEGHPDDPFFETATRATARAVQNRPRHAAGRAASRS